MHFQLNENIATRNAFGEALAKFGGRHKNVIVLDADLSGSVKTEKFAGLYPDRHFNFGIAESNMVNSAAGMAIRGKIPFACSFAVFSTGRAWEHIRNSICYPNMNVKIVGSHAGILTGEDGATHQALEDIAIMRALPNMKVICPADAVETYLAIEEIMNDFGPTYIRLGRMGVPVIYGKDHKFRIGFGDILTYGEDVALIATGTMVSKALEAAKLLGKEGVRAMVVNISTIKPIDKDLIIDCAKKTKLVITLEDHGVIGGLGGAVAEVLSQYYPAKMRMIGMRKFGESGKPEDLYKKYKLDGEGVTEQVLEFMKEVGI
ncbi:transketolase family protein [Patescibacteria group bacterium]|nr:transketolase family protein [Patescibacteria group bacterium]